MVTHSSLPLGASELVDEGRYLVPPEYTRKHAPKEKWQFDRISLTRKKYAWTSTQIRTYVAHFIDYRREIIVRRTERIRPKRR